MLTFDHMISPHAVTVTFPDVLIGQQEANQYFYYRPHHRNVQACRVLNMYILALWANKIDFFR